MQMGTALHFFVPFQTASLRTYFSQNPCDLFNPVLNVL
jgi:hypothetical protein